MHVSLQLTSHTVADITKIRWTRCRKRRGVGESRSAAERPRENYFFERSWRVGPEGRVERISAKRDFALQSPSCTPRAYISTYSMRARGGLPRKFKESFVNTVLIPIIHPHTVG